MSPLAQESEEVPLLGAPEMSLLPDKEGAAASGPADLKSASDFCPDDFLNQLELAVEAKAFELEEKEKAGTGLSDAEAICLQACKTFLATVKKEAGKLLQKKAILAFYSCVDRKPNLASPMILEQVEIVCNLTSNAFDRLVYMLLFGTYDEFLLFPPKPPAEFRKLVEDVVLANSDPHWTAQGESGQSENRLSWTARLALACFNCPKRCRKKKEAPWAAWS